VLQNPEEAIMEIQQGNEALRQELISSYKDFIYRYTSYICKRKLHWENDDELSVALIAFNEALDKFETRRGKNFSLYARVLIKNRLIDYFRKQSDPPQVSWETQTPEGKTFTREEALSFDNYVKEMEDRDRAFELQIFKETLLAFGLTMAELPDSSPDHRDTREKLKEVAREICKNEELVKKIYKDKKLPLKEIQALTGMKRKTLEKWRKYLLSLIIILTNPDLGILSEYIGGKEA